MEESTTEPDQQTPPETPGHLTAFNRVLERGLMLAFKGLRVGIPWILAIIFLGLMSECFSGLVVARSVRSPGAWVVGILLLGSGWALGELGSAWIIDDDRVTDPLWKRSLRLGVLLLLGGLLCLATWAGLRALS